MKLNFIIFPFLTATVVTTLFNFVATPPPESKLYFSTTGSWALFFFTLVLAWLFMLAYRSFMQKN